MMKPIFISMAWWTNRTVIILKIRENCMQNNCITQKWQFGVLLIKLLSLVLIFLKILMHMLWLWTPSNTLRWLTTLCLNYNKNVCLSDVYDFSRVERWPTQPEYQWTCFAFSLVTASFPGLLTFLSPSVS